VNNYTFKPLSRGRYKCNQTGQVLTQRQILNGLYEQFTGQKASIKVGASGPAKKSPKKRSSKYATKQ
jgi:hypothetical protein